MGRQHRPDIPVPGHRRHSDHRRGARILWQRQLHERTARRDRRHVLSARVAIGLPRPRRCRCGHHPRRIRGSSGALASQRSPAPARTRRRDHAGAAATRPRPRGHVQPVRRPDPLLGRHHRRRIVRTRTRRQVDARRIGRRHRHADLAAQRSAGHPGGATAQHQRRGHPDRAERPGAGARGTAHRRAGDPGADPRCGVAIVRRQRDRLFGGRQVRGSGGGVRRSAHRSRRSRRRPGSTDHLSGRQAGLSEIGLTVGVPWHPQLMADLPTPKFLDERVAHWAATKPDEEAITYLSRTWTWSQWYDRVRRAAGALSARGVKRGDVVAFLDKNHPACAEVVLAAASLGAATAIINFRLAADEMDYVLNDSGAKILFVGAELKPGVEEIRDALPGVSEIIEVRPEGDDEYEAMLSAATPVGRAPDVETDDVCIIMYSSGTTGRPKGVALTQANVIAHTINSFDGWVVEPDDKNLVSMPLFHVGGTSSMQYGLHNGVPSYMTRDVDGAALAGGILAGANRTFLVPAVLAKVLDTGPEAVKLFGGLKTYAYGASPMPLPLLRSALQAWPDTEFIQVYGLTEVCGAITRLMPEDHRSGDEERMVSAGKLVPQAEMRV